jgi:phage terminase large subunit GpA-like protein
MGARDLTPNAYASAQQVLGEVLARALAPRKPLTVSQWADLHRRTSSKGSAIVGQWVTDRNPPLREPMDCMSARSPVKDLALMFPIQFGKTEVAINAVGYGIEHDPGPMMVCLPGEVSMNKWIAQKLQPMLDETPVVRAVLTSTASRDGANRREFKDFAGGQLYLEHAGSPSRLKSASVRRLIVDEFDEVAANFPAGDDPGDMLDGRTSAFPGTYKRLYISSPQIKGISRIEAKWLKSDQRRFHVPCPHCGHEQPLEWGGLKWGPRIDGQVTGVYYTCRECGASIEEHHKPDMIRAGRWVAEAPGPRLRGYHINCLYYQIGLGPRWADLVEMWLDAQGDPAKLKTFVNDRLAEPWEDPAMRAIRHNAIAERAEPYKLRAAPVGVLVVTVGVDTQDNRLAVQFVGWGPRPSGAGLAFWVLDYVELPGDPADDAVWAALTDLLNQPLERADGARLRVEAMANDIGGHRTEAVKAYIRSNRVRRPMAIFGAVANNAPVLAKPKPADVTWRGVSDKRGVMTYQVGTVNAKHWLYGLLSTDAEKPAEERATHFSDELAAEYFAGLVSETYNPAKNRFDKKRGARNEPLDTWVYAFAAAHHPELRLHTKKRVDWEAIAARLSASAAAMRGDTARPVDADVKPTTEKPTPKPATPAVPAGRTGGRYW